MRILGNNKIFATGATNGASIYEHQRIFFDPTTVLNGPFLVGTSVTGSVSLVTGTILAVGANWLDVKLPDDINFLNPNQGQAVQSTETLTSGATTAGTLLNINDNISGRPRIIHPDFPATNLSNTNRNMITPAKSYQDLQERNFKYLKLATSFIGTEPVSCIAIVGHNLTSTATVQVHVFNGVNEVYTNTITDPNRLVSKVDTRRAADTGSTRASNADSNNVFIMYFPTEYVASTIEIDIVDINNPDPYIWVGSTYVGPYWETQSDTYYGWANTITDTSTTVYAQSPYSIERPKYHIMDLIHQNLTSTEADDWKFLFHTIGTHTDMILDTFSNTLDDNEKSNCYYCRFSTNVLAVANPGFNSYALNVQFRESI